MLSLYSISALAGHGFMNSFANIEWLPEAGLTPNQSFYFLDSFAEKIEILLSQREGHQGEAYLKLSKEKLAEIVEMAKKERTEETQLATRHYFEYLNRAFEENGNEKSQKYLTILTTILEHRYILGFEYPELTEGDGQQIIRNTDSALNSLYKKIEELIPRHLSDSLFFKKDEINWIWEIATEKNGG